MSVKCSLKNCRNTTRIIISDASKRIGTYCDKHACKKVGCIYTNDCILHMCQDYKCTNRSIYGKHYCKLHMCPALNCKQNLPCKAHTCLHVYPYKSGSSICKIYCKNVRTITGEYCGIHSCNISGCTHCVKSCMTHRCQYSGCENRSISGDIKCCYQHICGVEKCVNCVGKCDRHSCELKDCVNRRESIWKKCIIHLTNADMFIGTDYAKVLPRDIIGIISKYLNIY